MTATNHAVTGAVVALAVKQPLAAIVLAFLSHFIVDVVPHYNPPGVVKHVFTNHSRAWRMKFNHPHFKYYYWGDMFLLGIIMLTFPFVLVSDVSSWTIFLAMLASISPDLVGGRFLIYKWLGIKRHDKPGKFTRFHIWCQFTERPWGIYVEFGWFVLMLLALNFLVK